MNTDRAKVEAILGIDGSNLFKALKSARDIEKVDQIMQLLQEARINEHQLPQHQGMNVLDKTPKSILGWSELRVEQLKEEK